VGLRRVLLTQLPRARRSADCRVVDRRSRRAAFLALGITQALKSTPLGGTPGGALPCDGEGGEGGGTPLPPPGGAGGGPPGGGKKR
jgi:hypothetical protein